MKVLILANNEYTIYGFRMELLHALRRRGDEVVISLPKGEYSSSFEEFGCIVEDTKISQHGMNPFNDLLLYKRYLEIIRKIRPSIIITYTIKPNLYGGLASIRAKKPYISTVTGLGRAFEKGNIIKYFAILMYKISMRKVKVLFFQNRGQSDMFDKFKIADKRHVIVPGSGVNLAKHCFEEYPSNQKTEFLFVGRVTRDKGIYELLEAYRGLIEMGANAHLSFVGPIDEQEKPIVAQYADEVEVDFWGMQTDVHEYMKAADVIVLPSYHEGLANVLLEAAATGRPILTTDIPGCRETVVDGITGYLCKAKDVESLQSGMIKVLNLSREQRKRMGIAGRKKIEQEFDRSIVIEKMLDWIDR